MLYKRLEQTCHRVKRRCRNSEGYSNAKITKAIRKTAVTITGGPCETFEAEIVGFIDQLAAWQGATP